MKKALKPRLYELTVDEGMFAIVVLKDGENVPVLVNRAASQMLRGDQFTLENLEPTREQQRPQLKSFGADVIKHEGFYQDILVRNLENETFIANVGVRRVTVDEDIYDILMFQDVTLQKKLQREIMAKQTEIKSAFAELLNQNSQLKELDLAKDRFIALTTHELRTPLSAMVAGAEILKLKLFDTPEEMNEFIDIIYDQGLHLVDLVNDILDFAKVQAGRMDFYVEESNPLPIIEKLVKNFASMAEAAQVTIALESPQTPATCYFDGLRLRQIVSNMVNNAIKYNKPGGSVTVQFAVEEEWVKILVKDTGQGIPKDKLTKVFNEFETVGQVSKHHKGTGLGMPISRKLAEGMGGRLQLESELGVGSTFWIEIPRLKVLDEELYRSRPESDDLAA